MAGFSLAQLEQLWEEAGGSVTTAPQAAAIAQAESSGNPTASNLADPAGGSFGLWQINNVHASALANAGLTKWQTDPLQNAKAAVMVYNAAGGFTGPWAAEFISGSAASQRYQSAVQAEAAGNLGAPAVWNQNPAQAWITGALTGNNGTATAATNGQAATNANQANTTKTVNPLLPFDNWLDGIAPWWNSHPVGLLVIGLAFVVVAAALMKDGGMLPSPPLKVPPVPV